MTKNHVVRRKNGNFSFRITVPKEWRVDVGKKEIWESLNTTNRTVANALAARRVLHWKGVFLSYQSQNESLGTNAQKERADILGFDFYRAQQLSEANTKDKVAILANANIFLGKVETPTREQVAANGGVVEDNLSLDEAFARYQELASGKWNDLNPRQHQKKWNRYLEPIKDFKREIGDIDVLKITSTDVGNYVVNLGKRLKSKEIVSETAVKKLGFLSKVIGKVLQTDFPNHKNPFEGAEIEHNGNDKTRRHTLTESEIVALETHLSNSKANDELKAVLTVLAHTGAIASEIVLLHEDDIVLDAEIPFIKIGPNANRSSVKTDNRPRDIPLVGPALEAFKKFPKGFPRYCRPIGPEAFSASANKIIKQVAPTATTYSLRHRFIDWLREVESMEDSWLKSIIGHDGLRQRLLNA